MQSISMGGRTIAIAAGLLFTAGAAGILLEDVILHGAPLTLKHYLTIVTIFGTMMVGHLTGKAKAHRHWLAMLGFASLFVAGTGLTVYSSVGRQAASVMVAAAEAETADGARIEAHAGLKRAQAMLDEELADLARECKTGKGSKCDGIRTSVETYQSSVRGFKADLDRLGPPKVAVPEARRAGELAAVFGFNASKVEAAAILVVPFLTTLLFEFGAIVSLGYGFRTSRNFRTVAKPSDTAQTSFSGLAPIATFSGEFPEPQPPTTGKRRKNRNNVVPFSSKYRNTHPVISALESSGGSVASNRELSRLMNVTEGESSKRVSEVADRLVIRRVGKETRISLRKATA